LAQAMARPLYLLLSFLLPLHLSLMAALAHAPLEAFSLPDLCPPVVPEALRPARFVSWLDPGEFKPLFVRDDLYERISAIYDSLCLFSDQCDALGQDFHIPSLATLALHTDDDADGKRKDQLTHQLGAAARHSALFSAKRFSRARLSFYKRRMRTRRPSSSLRRPASAVLLPVSPRPQEVLERTEELCPVQERRAQDDEGAESPEPPAPAEDDPRGRALPAPGPVPTAPSGTSAGGPSGAVLTDTFVGYVKKPSGLRFSFIQSDTYNERFGKDAFMQQSIACKFSHKEFVVFSIKYGHDGRPMVAAARRLCHVSAGSRGLPLLQALLNFTLIFFLPLPRRVRRSRQRTC